MTSTFHILNGDSLKEQFPSSLEGEVIVARECLVDGPVKADDLAALFEMRAEFIEATYGDYTKADYIRDSRSEFDRIKQIQAGSTVYLWFEDDLFCQVNLWFVGYLIHQLAVASSVYLVRPSSHTPYGFAALSEDELKEAFHNAILLNELPVLSGLWTAYQHGDLDTMMALATDLARLPFIKEAVQAHIDRLPHDGQDGKPMKTLKAIVSDMGTEQFGPVFREFCKREAIYGFGDLQVKRMFDQIIANSN